MPKSFIRPFDFNVNFKPISYWTKIYDKKKQYFVLYIIIIVIICWHNNFAIDVRTATKNMFQNVKKEFLVFFNNISKNKEKQIRVRKKIIILSGQTSVQRPPLGPQNKGRCWHVVVVVNGLECGRQIGDCYRHLVTIWRWSLAQVWLYFNVCKSGIKGRYDQEFRGRIFSQAENELRASSFPARNELSMLFPNTLFPAWNKLVLKLTKNSDSVEIGYLQWVSRIWIVVSKPIILILTTLEVSFIFWGWWCSSYN